MIATANVSPTYKVKWLKWMNASSPTREACQFPAHPVNEEKLLKSLAKACWYAGMEDAATEMFEFITTSDNISINYSVSTEPQTLAEYIESCRMKLWDHAYMEIFKGNDSFKKSNSFKEFKESMLAVKRLIYRYFKFELYAKKAIKKANLPSLFTTWLDHSSPDCMFSPSQLKNWICSHLQACPWYLECNQGFTPSEEDAFFYTLKMLDKQVEKEKDKGKKKGTKRKLETTLQELATSKANLKDTSPGFFLTEELLRHGLLPTFQNVEPVSDLDECILNMSVGYFFGMENNPTPKAYDDVLSFMEMHSSDKDRYFNGVLSPQPAVNLILVDVPEGLHVPTISSPPAPIPLWNWFSDKWLLPIFDFASEYLHDHGGLIIMYPFSRRHKANLLGCCKSYGFKIVQSWLGFNCLHLTKSSNPSMTTMRFEISLLVKEIASTFSFQTVPSHDAVGVDVAKDDVLQNFCGKSDVAMNSDKPWRGPREKARTFIQLLVEACSLPGDVVMDCTAATGSSIHTCRATRRHILAFEEDKAVFDALIAPIIRTTLVP